VVCEFAEFAGDVGEALVFAGLGPAEAPCFVVDFGGALAQLFGGGHWGLLVAKIAPMAKQIRPSVRWPLMIA
jgi:hypothetical protein